MASLEEPHDAEGDHALIVDSNVLQTAADVTGKRTPPSDLAIARLTMPSGP